MRTVERQRWALAYHEQIRAIPCDFKSPSYRYSTELTRVAVPRYTVEGKELVFAKETRDRKAVRHVLYFLAFYDRKDQLAVVPGQALECIQSNWTGDAFMLDMGSESLFAAFLVSRSPTKISDFFTRLRNAVSSEDPSMSNGIPWTKYNMPIPVTADWRKYLMSKGPTRQIEEGHIQRMFAGLEAVGARPDRNPFQPYIGDWIIR